MWTNIPCSSLEFPLKYKYVTVQAGFSVKGHGQSFFSFGLLQQSDL